jgi:flagellar M-ring protein FliF
MPENMSRLLNRGSRSFGALTLAQKVIALATVLGLVVGGYLFLGWVSKPTFAPLYTDLAAKDASAIVDQLNSSGVTYQLGNGGSTILVPKDKVYSTRLALSGKGLAPSSGSTGWGLLDKQGITTSNFQQQVAYRRALEGELSNTIEALDGVTGAVVHLAVPDKSVFTTETEPTKASVLVSTAPGHDLTSDQVQAVVNLVSSSVTDLKPANVTVADSAGHVLSSSADGSPGSVADTRAQETRDYETRVEQSLQAMIDRVVGAGHSEVRLTADLDFDQTHTTTETYKNSATVPLAGSTTTEKFTGNGATATGVLGAGTAPTGTGAGTAGTYSKTSTTDNNALDRVVEDRTSAPGAVRRLNVAVLLDSATAAQANTAQIQSLVSSAVGLTPSRGDSVVVSALPFDTSAATSAATELKAAAKAKASAARNRLLLTAGKWLLVLIVLAVVLLMLRRSLFRASRSAEDRREIEALQRALAVREARELTEGTTAELAGPGARGELPGPRTATVAESINTTDPDEVAQLLRGWLSEPRS